MCSLTAISYRDASDWSRVGAGERLKRMARSAHKEIVELERTAGGMFRESLSAEYHLRYAEANLYDHLSGHKSLADDDSRRAYLLLLMDHPVLSPIGNSLPLNEGMYRSQMVLRLADFLTNV